jgi:hypothetical protein
MGKGGLIATPNTSSSALTKGKAGGLKGKPGKKMGK